jgi:hypothetical protein
VIDKIVEFNFMAVNGYLQKNKIKKDYKKCIFFSKARKTIA